MKISIQTPLLPYIALLVAAACIVLSLAPYNIWPLSIFALVIFHQTLLKASLKQSIYRSFFFGLSLYLIGVHWVWVSMHEHGGASAPLATFMTLAFCAILSLFLITPFGALFYYLKHNTLGKTLGFAACWFLHEWTSTWLFTGFPWLFLGYGHTQSLFSGLAPIIGTLGISFLIALTAALLSSAKTAYKQRLFQCLALTTAIIWAASPLLKSIAWTQKKTDTPYKVALVQPNYTLEQKWDVDMILPIRDFYRSTLPALKDQDIILWPESAFTEIYQDVPNFLGSLSLLAAKNNTALIFGMPTEWDRNGYPIYYNSIHALGIGSGMYHKQKLVPFGEYVPFEEQLRGLIRFFDLPLSEFSKGPKSQKPLKAKDLVVAPYICYELVYPDFVSKTAKDADLLLTVSNDTWFGRSIGPKQHMQMAQMRALENGRYLIRGTNDGITAVVDPQGSIIAQLPQFTRGTLKSKVYAMKGFTPLAHYGTLPFLIISILIVLILIRPNQK